MVETWNDPWDWFDALPPNIRRAHQTVFTGTLLFAHSRSCEILVRNILPELADVILELDSGKMLLSERDFGGLNDVPGVYVNRKF